MKFQPPSPSDLPRFCLFGMLSNANAAPASSEDRYIAARDAAIEKISKLYDDSKGDEAAKAEEAATTDLLAQMKAILPEPDRQGFGPAKLNIGSFYKGDEGFGTLDGLRFESLLGENGQKAGSTGKDEKYVEPKSHIVVTTQTIFESWLRAHKEFPQRWPRRSATKAPTPRRSRTARRSSNSSAADRKTCRRDVCLRHAGGADAIRNSRCLG